MKLIVEFFGKYNIELEEEGVRLQFLGKIEDLPEKSLATVKRAEEESKNRDRITLNIALSYGSRQEIIRATKAFTADAISGNREIEELNQEVFSSYLYTQGLPDPDLLIRTGGEQRISNFLLIVFCEFIF